MFARLLQLHVIAAILVCPVWCESEVCWGADDGCAPSEKCDHSAPSCPNCADEQSDHNSSPHKHQPCGHRCQCVCAGAIIKQHDNDLTKHISQPLEAVVVTKVPLAEVLFERNIVTVLPYRGSATPGRIICCLHMSFLC